MSSDRQAGDSMKERLDILMMERNLAASREKARAVIMSGDVYVNGVREDKAGTMFDPDKAEIEVRGPALAYVSRGGLKLEKAIKVFGPDLSRKVCMDIGASTGGFTDCMLQNGAKRVYAVDVGHGQLDWKLRTDPRVICMEKTNFRYFTPDMVPEKIEFAASDVSFISLQKILGPARDVLADEGYMVCLIKPQFEAGRAQVGKKGVVRDPDVHTDVINTVMGFAASLHFRIMGLDFSPVRGPEGNIEYLLYLRKEPDSFVQNNADINAEDVVGRAHRAL